MPYAGCSQQTPTLGVLLYSRGRLDYQPHSSGVAPPRVKYEVLTRGIMYLPISFVNIAAVVFRRRSDVSSACVRLPSRHRFAHLWLRRVKYTTARRRHGPNLVAERQERLAWPSASLLFCHAVWVRTPHVAGSKLRRSRAERTTDRYQTGSIRIVRKPRIEI